LTLFNLTDILFLGNWKQLFGMLIGIYWDGVYDENSKYVSWCGFESCELVLG